MVRMWLGTLLAFFLAAAATAQPRMRPLDVRATAGWQHAQTGLILPSQIAGLARGGIQDSGTEELDVAAQYAGGADDLVATVYLYRSQIPSVPLWFDRARTVLEQMPHYGLNGGDRRPATAFALPGSGVATGLRITYPVAANGLTSTALAIAPVNGWIVKVRLSSRSLAPTQLDQRLGEFLSGIGWPKANAPAQAAVRPIEACPTSLSYKRAKLLKPDMAGTLLGSLGMVLAASKTAGPPPTYCRDSKAELTYGVYRAAGSNSGYVLALTDAGRAIGVHQALSLDNKKKPPFAVTLMELGHSSVFPSFDRLPHPTQVMEMLAKTRPLSSSKVGSTVINVAAEPN